MGLGFIRRNSHLAGPSASLALSGSETPRSVSALHARKGWLDADLAQMLPWAACGTAGTKRSNVHKWDRIATLSNDNSSLPSGFGRDSTILGDSSTHLLTILHSREHSAAPQL
jgi:hypothetical protein